MHGSLNVKITTVAFYEILSLLQLVNYRLTTSIVI